MPSLAESSRWYTSEAEALALGGMGGKRAREPMHIFGHDGPQDLQRPRLAAGAYSESRFEQQIDLALRTYCDMVEKNRAGVCSIYADAMLTEVYDALMDGLTVGKQEPVRVNAALRRLLQNFG